MKTISLKTGTAIIGRLIRCDLPEVSIDSLFEAINDKDEITQLALYSEIKGVEPISEIDEKLLEFFEGE